MRLTRRELAFALLLSLSVFALSSAYYFHFAHALDFEDWLDVDGFTRLVIPDTFAYQNALDYSDPLGSVLSSGVKNTLGPSLLWFLATNRWIPVIFANAVFLFFTLLYLARTARLMEVRAATTLRLMALVALLPTTLYYSIGALKELPTLFGLTGFFYHYIRGNRSRWLAFICLSVLFRYQLAFVFVFFLVFVRFGRRAVPYAFLTLMLVAAMYPLIHLQMFEAETTASYRDLFGAAGSAGGWVESVRETVPVASAGAVLIRIVQSIFEPLLAFGRRPSFIEDGSISIWGLALVGAALILLRYWLTFIRRLVIMIIEKPRVDREVTQLYTFCLVFIFPVAGFSFIQSRYLYPVTVLMLVAAVVGVPGRGVALGHPKTSGVGHSPDAPVDY